MNDGRAQETRRMADDLMTLSFGVAIGGVGAMSGWPPINIVGAGVLGIFALTVASSYFRAKSGRSPSP